jgi:hypothetical protein
VTQDHPFAILLPLLVGVVAVACTIFVHALAMAATIHFVRYERKLGRAGASPLINLEIVTLAISIAFAAHLIEIALWAVLLILCGELRHGLLSLGGQLFDAGLWRAASDTLVAAARTIGSDQWRAHVRCFGGNDLRRRATVGSGEI